MPHRRPPSLSDSRDTLDEAEPVRSDLEASDVVTAADYYDREPNDPREPRTRDLEARVAELERGDRRKSKRRTWTERALSFLAGSGLAILVWVITKADANGDARATAREREAERIWMRDSVRLLLDRDAKREGQIEMLQERLRYYPVHGPQVSP